MKNSFIHPLMVQRHTKQHQIYVHTTYINSYSFAKKKQQTSYGMEFTSAPFRMYVFNFTFAIFLLFLLSIHCSLSSHFFCIFSFSFRIFRFYFLFFYFFLFLFFCKWKSKKKKCSKWKTHLKNIQITVL